MSQESLEHALPVRPGTVVANKYRVEKLVAAGGMGAVLKAQHVALDQAVAIKIMRPELADRAEAAQRFLREARAAAKIASDYVARVTDVDVLEDGTPFMVMEYLEGQDLDQVLDQESKLPIARAVDYAMQALAGLGAAHAMGVVHRDLKPSNLFLVRRADGGTRVKLLDFGISKIVDSVADQGLKAGATTSAGATLGTPRYMSPEQISSSKSVDTRTDLWATGVILYEMLGGSYPFHGDNSGEILASILTHPVRPLAELRADIPDQLAAAVHRSLEKRRDDRFTSAHEMMRALAPFASKRMQALVADLEDVASVATIRGARGDEPTQRSAGTPPRGVAAGEPTSGRTALTRVDTPEAERAEGDGRRAELEGAPTKLSSMVPPRKSSPPTDSNMSVGSTPRAGGRIALGAVIVAAVLGLAGGVFLLGRGSGSQEKTPAGNAPTSIAEATNASRPSDVSVTPSPVVSPGAAAPAETAAASVELPTVGDAPSASAKAAAPPATGKLPKPPASARTGNPLLDTRD